jgi:hypothetical protein
VATEAGGVKVFFMVVVPPVFNDLNYTRQYFLERAGELLNISGTPWCFAGGTCIIDYLSSMVAGHRGDRFDFIDFVRANMQRYANFQYQAGHRRQLRNGTTDNTGQDLPEQMYYILRCGLLHRFSPIPTTREINNGGRPRSIVLTHRAGAEQAHLSNYANGVITDAAHFVAEDFIDDIQNTVRIVFGDRTNHVNILAYLNATPPIFLF